MVSVPEDCKLLVSSVVFKLKFPEVLSPMPILEVGSEG